MWRGSILVDSIFIQQKIGISNSCVEVVWNLFVKGKFMDFEIRNHTVPFTVSTDLVDQKFWPFDPMGISLPNCFKCHWPIAPKSSPFFIFVCALTPCIWHLFPMSWLFTWHFFPAPPNKKSTTKTQSCKTQTMATFTLSRIYLNPVKNMRLALHNNQHSLFHRCEAVIVYQTVNV